MKMTQDTANEEMTSEAGAEKEYALQNTLLQILTEGVAVLKDRRFVWVNHAMTEISGFSEDELLGQTTAIIYASAEDYDPVGKEAYATLSAGGTYEFEMLIQRKDLEMRLVRIKGRLIDTADSAQGSIWVMEDITERRRSEDLLREDDRRYRDLFESSRDAIATTDMTGMITDCNQAFLQLTGYDCLAEVKKLSYLDLTPREYHAMEIGLLETQLMDRGHTDEYEKEYIRKDGTRVAISLRTVLRRDQAGNPLEMWAWIRDITERKRLRKADATLQLILNYLQSGVCIFDPNLELILCNAKFKELLDLPEELFARRLPSLQTLLHFNAMRGEYGPGDPGKIAAAGVANIKRMEPFVFDQTRPNGAVLEVRGTPLLGGGFIIVFSDVTGRKRTKMALRKLNQELEIRVAERTAQLRDAKEAAELANQTKSQFLGRMSHELRTPLNSILGYAQILQASADDTPIGKERECIDAIFKSGWYLLRLIKDLLDLSAVESNKVEMHLETVHVSTCIDECLMTIGPMARERTINIVSSPECQHQAVLADRVRLMQVLLNLLTNATKYNRSGGSIHVNCRRSPPDRIRISVTDTGSGIPAEHFTSLFEPFSRLHERAYDIEGVGIGLAISKHLVELMGGTVGVVSEPGQGSTFWIELKTGGEAAPIRMTEPKGPDRTSHVSIKPFKMLYIEDSPSHVGLMQRIVAEMNNIELLTTHSAHLSLELVRAHKLDVILCDINLPDMDGYELLQQLMSDESTRHIPVIAISASAMPKEIERGLAAGFRRYITKPIDVVNFRKIIVELLVGEVVLESRTASNQSTNGAPHEQKISTSSPAIASMRHTVLYVEDDRLNTAMMLNLLSHEDGLKILTAPTGELGLEVARAQQPDLIILDIGLPGIDGLEVLHQLRNDPLTQHIPAIALTGYDMMKKLCEEAGFDYCLTKPFLSQELIRIIGVLLEE